jgi:DNA primase
MLSDVEQLKLSLTDVRSIVQLLELDNGATRQQNGLKICCPWHAENVPSCSVTIGREGTLRAKCFGCDRIGDVFDLIAIARDLDVGHDFPQILDIASAMAGYTLQENRRPPKMKQLEYPDAYEISSAWEHFTGNPLNNKDTRAWLVRRKIDYLYSRIDIMCRAIKQEDSLDRTNYPNLFRRWRQTGHKLVFPLYDYQGKMRNFSGRYVGKLEGVVKSKTPKGYKKEGLCLMNLNAIHGFSPISNRGMHTLFITEGEPDFLTLAMTEDYPVIGIVGHGSITEDYKKRLNTLRKVVICTDADKAGNIYAENIKSLLDDDIKCLRLDVNDLLR